MNCDSLWPTPDEKQCKSCKKFLPATTEFFHASTVNRGGLLTQCIPCERAYRNMLHALKHPKPEKPIPPPGYKFCLKCNQAKLVNLENFRTHARSRDGFYNVCRQCVYEQDRQRTHGRHENFPPTFDENILKECSRCHAFLSATPAYFHRNKRNPDGLMPECKECRHKRSKEYRLRNPDAAQWHRFMYKQANRESIREKGRAYSKAHRAEQNAHVKVRHTQIKQNGGDYTARDVLAQYKKQEGKCYWCHRQLDKYHVDHMHPISRGGSNGPENIVIACPFCNQSKGNKTVEEWLLYLEKFIL